MMYVRIACSFCLLCCAGCISRAQLPAGIKHSYAFFSIHMPGNIAVNPDGLPMHAGPDTLFTIYLETGTAPPIWTSAWMKGRTYSVSCFPVTGSALEAGTSKASGEKRMVTAAGGNRLWRLELSPAEKAKMPPRMAKGGEIILLEGKSGRRPVVLGLNRIEELASIPSV